MLFKTPIFIFFLSFVFIFVLGIIVFSALVVLIRNPIHSVLALIVVFCCTTVVFLLLGLEFIAITFLVVYVGAIAVLFLFVVMMLNIKIMELDEIYWRYLPVGLVVSMFFLISILPVYPLKQFFLTHCYIIALYKAFKYGSVPTYEVSGFINWQLVPEFYNSNTLNLAVFLYTYNFYLFILIGLILLVAMVGTIALVLTKRVFQQPVYKQILRKSTISWMGYSDQYTQRCISKIQYDLKNF